MNCHQVLSGACNSGDQCFAVGSVEGIPFTAYAAGCNIVILASNFDRVQIIPGAIHGYVRIGSLDCSTDTGKIAAAYGAEVCIFEPTPLIHTANTSHGLEYRWVQTGKLVADGPITALSWNLEGTRLLTGGKILQLWHQASLYQDDSQPSSGVTFQIGGDRDDKPKQPEEEEPGWICVWQCQTATPAHHLAFSPDGVLFATSGVNDRLVKIWYQNKVLSQTQGDHCAPQLNYTFIYVAHPRAVTHLSWRKTSKYMPKGSVGNVLVTSSVDNICRVWAETLLPEDEWGGGGVTSHSRSPPRRQRATHRHKHRFMQRLKHMKTCFHIRRNAQSSKQPGAPIPTLPSTYSAHDFHNPYHATSYTGGLHFHLAASINAETDIPLVPSLAGGGRFILHWLHNKEMYFTSQAEAILHDLTKKVLDKEETDEGGSGSDHTAHPDGENDGRHANRRPSQHLTKVQSEDNSNSDEQPGSGNHSHPSLSNTTSINSIATDVTCTHLPDSLDAKIDALLRDWHQSPDLLFSIHPVDGSFLIWVCEWLDELHAGAIRQAQVSFSARIPSAFPLGDATTMCTPAALYHAAAQPLYVRHRTKPVIPGNQQQQTETVTTPLASVQEEKEETEWPQNEEQNQPQENGAREENNNDMQRKLSIATEDFENQEGDVLDSAPVISMVTNHANGTLNLWQLTFDDKSKFTQVLSIGHASRASGHRFRVNDITCHPVLPLLLTTSHHNISDSERDHHKFDDDTAAGGLCSELIMWRVECVGPLGKSGGVSELARVNSPHLSAFSNVAWLPTLLPSTTLGNLSNSPSACFVASDGESLRVFQAVIDSRTLLAEISTSERRHRDHAHDTLSMSSDSTLSEGGGVPLHERIRIVSQQSTARPGAIIQLHAIADATHDWHNTQLLHVFQEQLITGERTPPDNDADSGVDACDVNTITEAGLEAIVDLRKAATFNEPFYIVVLERTDGGSTVHMWRLTVSSQADPNEDFTNSMRYMPDSALIQEDEGMESRKNSVSMDNDRMLPPPPPNSHLSITTKKVCECPLALPDGVDVIHATPAAGHLSSASIYPACLAPYILATACSDSTLRFWKCNVTKTDNDIEYTWNEWEMMNKDQESTIDIPGQPLHISAAYSGRIACAYKCGRSFTRPKGASASTNNISPDARFVNLCVCVYECESTGGAEWLLEDTIPLRNVSLPRVGVCADTQIDLSYLHDTSFIAKKQRINQVLQTLSSDESRNNRNGEAEGKSAGLLAVPSFSTLQSLRRSIMENGNTCPLTQKHLVQLDWVSKEDGSHILTVAVGSRVLLFTPVSSDLAQANLKAMKESINNNRPILRKASSLAAPLFVEEIRWMQLRRIELKTADGLPPLPMQISWVRDGILVVGMDSEMHVYSQWKPENPQMATGQMGGQELEEGSESRALRDSDLRVSAPHLQRVSSINLQLLERDARRRNKTQPDQPQPLLDYMPDYGLFEASQMACPVLPQYHPKQLMELLNSGKIRWVKAILAHLVRCIGGTYTTRTSQGDEDSLSRQRGWSRSRTLSVSFAAGAASPIDGVAQITEDVQLDYAEITSVPPLPLWTLLVADKESAHHPSTIQEAKDYNELFEGTIQDTDEDLDALLLGDEEAVNRRPSMPERQPLSHFGPRQGRILSRLLTHTHLPGLSSLDQMHLLALADTVSTCDADVSERLANSTRVDVTQGSTHEILPDSLDDCGLRFLLAIKHYGYLLRCLPLAQRANLQRNGVGTCNLVWAFHSESHEQLLALIPGYAKGQPKWTTMRELGVGWWVRGELLKTCVERLARAAYKQNQDPMDAALYYLAMKKRTLLWGLFRSNCNEKMTTFFANDFTEDRWRKAALKNAFVLLGKQRFEHAAAFFLLGGALKDALEVLITRLGDLQLAMVVARLYDSDSALPASLKKLLMDEILGVAETEQGELDMERAHPDPFVRSMALWELKRYGAALDTLLSPAGRLHASRENAKENPNTDPMPSVFNFYVYLRTHPRLKRNNLPSQGGTLALLQKEDDEGITRLERRLYFQTAHGHFKAGCPALALEVLSKLPARVRDERPKAATETTPQEAVHTGQLLTDPAKKEDAASVDWGASSLDWSAPVAAVKTEELNLDWGAPVSSMETDELKLDWGNDEDDKDSNASGASTPPLEMKIGKSEEPLVNGLPDKEKENEEAPSVDIMAQQLKFVACLKILMEELSTLATGFEVDGGHLRYQLYIWLEREVEALRRLCGYASTRGAGADKSAGGELVCAEAEPPPLPDRPTLHQLLIREKADFEAKVQRAVSRKKWLKANETLLRTLLSYCSLHGAGGGGLASVRMELVLLLQELGQDKQHQQLLSPLPFPTTLPLLAAAVATNNTVVADPVRHLQSVAHDMLGTIGELGIPGGSATRLLHTLRELAVALSACIYQSLCDSDTFSLKHTHHHDGIIAETPGTSQMLARTRRHSTEELAVSTTPNKWPGVSALRGLALRAAEEDDAPRLPVLLAEAFCAVYLALLGWALAARDAHLLYRLAAHVADGKAHSRLFGGGIRKLLTTAPAPPQPKLVERPEGTSVWSSLREKRALLNMRLLGLGPAAPHKNIQEGRPTYREQFVPPHCSILTFLLTKPTAEQDPENYDYDSAESGAEDAEDSESDPDDDDIFDTSTNKPEKRRRGANTEHSDPDSYSWYVMRVAVLRLAQQKLQHFLQMAGIEMSELATTSPTVHGALRRVDQWQQQLTETLESRAPPIDYIPGCFPEQVTQGPPINKYRCLLEKHNTPFNSALFSAAPAGRLWSFLVRQEPVQDLFIRAVFTRRRTASVSTAVNAAGDTRAQRARETELHNPVRIIHKEQDSIAAFCLNKVGGCLLAVATAREVQEMDVSLLLRGGASWAEDECEVDLLGLAADPAALPDTGFLLIQHQDKPNSGSVPGTGNSSPLNPNAPQIPVGMASQTGRGASVVKGLQFPGCHDPKYCRLVLHRSKLLMKPVLKHKIDNIKRMAAHPTQPLYLTGGADGSVQLWEWGHGSCVWSPRAPGAFAKVTRVRFSDYGNKFAAADADGNLAMWQLHPAPQPHGQPQASPRPYFTHQCHSKGISDFVFLGSCSLVATAGHSSENKNVAIWDTLMPLKKALVVSWTCHEGGAACVAWAGSGGALVSCGRRGDVLVWDLRARAVRHRAQAHHAPIKCVALSPREDHYAIGAADGDIKVFSLTTHQLLYTFAGEHARSSFFKHIGQGVTQIHIDNAGRLFSCGADGTMKVRKLPERDAPPPHAHY